MVNDMREWIDLFEKTHSMRTGMGEEIIAVQDPNSQQLEVFLNKFHRLRGMIDDEGKLYIWDAMKMTHFGAEMQLGVKIELGFYLQERLDGRVGCRWDDYSGEGHSPEEYSNFNRMMRLSGVVLGKTEAVFEEQIIK